MLLSRIILIKYFYQHFVTNIIKGILREPQQWRARAALWTPLLYSGQWKGDKSVTNLKRFGRKLSWSNFKALKGLRKTVKDFSQRSRFKGLDMNPQPLE
jgi:hypothetical protein